MDVPSKTPTAPASVAWAVAVRLLVRWIEHHERADALLDGLPRGLSKPERARVQHLFFGALRHLGRLDAQISRRIERTPRTRLRAILLVAGFELIEGGAEGHVARVVHHSVEQAKTLASPAEARLVNAVVRKLATALAAQAVPPRLASAEELAEYFSHPAWLVRRWLGQLGAAPTRALLELNQRPATVFARWRDWASPPQEWLGAAVAPEFFEVPSGRWGDVEPLLLAGRLYLQDLATRHAVELLDPRTGETLLDLCAAPGGKSLMIADILAWRRRAAGNQESGTGNQETPPGGRKREEGEVKAGDVGPGTKGGESNDGGSGWGGAGRLVAFDIPGPRLARLKENLARAREVDVVLVAGDLLRSPARALSDQGLPVEYMGVLVDVPCSNTGVMRHRVDVKWRLQEGDFAKHARQQLALLHAAARLVAPEGRLVYSTCSLDEEENQRVVGEFLRNTGARFTLEKQVLSRPWETGHDGAAAFLLRRSVS